MPFMIVKQSQRGLFVGLAMLAAAYTPAHAQTSQPAGLTAPPEKYAATTVNLNPGGGEPVSIRISRWSTDAERASLVGLFAQKGNPGMQEALAAAPTIGYIWTSETVGYSVRYAHRVTTPDGTERVIVATDRGLGFWSRDFWKSSVTGLPDYPFTVIELRLRRGVGDGKFTLGAKVVVEADTKTIALENYTAAPVLLKDVKKEGAPGVSSAPRAAAAAGAPKAPASAPKAPAVAPKAPAPVPAPKK